MSAEIHVGDVGTRFAVTFTDQDGDPVSLAAATELQAVVQKPSGAILTKDLTVDDAAAGTAYWDSEEDDLDEPGTYQTQGYAVLAAWEGRSDIVEFTVYPNLG